MSNHSSHSAALQSLLKDNPMRIAWGLYNHDKRPNQKFNPEQFAKCLEVGCREIKRRVQFYNSRFSPPTKPFGWDDHTWTGKAWDGSTGKWVECNYVRIND